MIQRRIGRRARANLLIEIYALVVRVDRYTECLAVDRRHTGINRLDACGRSRMFLGEIGCNKRPEARLHIACPTDAALGTAPFACAARAHHHRPEEVSRCWIQGRFYDGPGRIRVGTRSTYAR